MNMIREILKWKNKSICYMVIEFEFTVSRIRYTYVYFMKIHDASLPQNTLLKTGAVNFKEQNILELGATVSHVR